MSEAEEVVSWKGRHNYELNSATVLRDVYRLITVVVADKGLASSAKDRYDPLVRLRDQFVEDELIHLLIGTAIANRLQDDHMRGPRSDESELSFKALEHECGTLLSDVTSDEMKPLVFREACNKIIHAAHIAVATETTEGGAYAVLPSIVELSGTLNEKSWIAKLDLLEYARGSVRNFEFA